MPKNAVELVETRRKLNAFYTTHTVIVNEMIFLLSQIGTTLLAVKRKTYMLFTLYWNTVKKLTSAEGKCRCNS